MAFDPRLIDDLARRLAGAVPENLVAQRRDLEKNIKGVRQSQHPRLDKVNREEIDLHNPVLKSTRQKMTPLERLLAPIDKTATGAA